MKAVLAAVALILTACSLRGPRSASEDPAPSLHSSPTDLSIEFVTDPTASWAQRLNESAATAEAILQSEEFASRCRASKMSRTNGKPVEQVCREFSHAGPIKIEVGFYHDPDTRAIAYEQNDVVYVNTAKSEAGSPGNIAHELAHVLGYTHFTNWAFLGRNSVPYVVGELVDSQAMPLPTDGR